MKRKSSSSSSKNNKVKKKKNKSNNSIRSLKKSNIRRIDDNSRKKNKKRKNNARLAISLSVPRQRQKKHQQSYSKSSKSLLKKKKEHQQQQAQQLFIKRSSGRKEKFDTNRMAQTVSRSGVPFLMARDVAKKVSTKIRNETNDSTKQITTKRKHNAGGNKVVPQTKLKREKEKEKTVTAGRIRNLVANELRDRNRSDIAASYTGQMPENTLKEQNLKDKQPIEDIVAANKNRVLHDTSKRGGGIMT